LVFIFSKIYNLDIQISWELVQARVMEPFITEFLRV